MPVTFATVAVATCDFCPAEQLAHISSSLTAAEYFMTNGWTFLVRYKGGIPTRELAAGPNQSCRAELAALEAAAIATPTSNR